MNPNGGKLVLGTRGSDLALTQTRMVEAALVESGQPAAEIEIRVIKTIGDKRPDLKLAEFSRGENPIVDKGIFTKELEEALLRGEIDVAVHSLKDVPTDLGSDFHIASTLPRAPVEDIVITKQQGWFDESSGLDRTVATSSVRRARQLRWLYPDLNVVDIRGNVPTRIRKLTENAEWDGIVLARAGLERLGILTPAETNQPGEFAFQFKDEAVFGKTLDPHEFLPAASQGAVAMESLTANETANAALSTINHQPTFERISAERAFLARLQAGCQTPVGALTWFRENESILAMKVRVFDEDDPEADPSEAAAETPAGNPGELADTLFEMIHHGEET